MAFTDLNKIFTRPFHIQELIDASEGVAETIAVLAEIKSALEAQVTAGHAADAEAGIAAFAARTIPDLKCEGRGYYPKNVDTGIADDGQYKRICNTCGGWGKTTVPAVYTRTFVAGEPYDDEV